MPVEHAIDPRPVDGVGTNENNPDWGATGTHLLNLAPSDLGPNGEMSGADRPNPREISNTVARQTEDTKAAGGGSDYLWIWGQFLDHDLSLTSAGGGGTADIPVPTGDVFFDPFNTGMVVIPFDRVEQDNGNFPNEITGFIDASMIYGSDADTVNKMRVENGKLLMTEDAQLMLEGADLITGDTRAAENVALSSMHTIFTREHNRIVDELIAKDPTLSDDELFDIARAHVEALVQAITFNEFLPLLVGKNAFDAYSGYDDSVNPGISIEFSTAVYRLGHTLLSSDLQLVEEDGTEKSPLALRDAFFRPSLLSEDGMIEDVLRGAATQHAQALDTLVVDDVRSFLFGPPGAGGLDLASLNIQRGRDLGIASYNDLREAIGKERAETFADITSDADLAAKLETLYGDPDKVDAWIGGLAEDPKAEGMLGETFAHILIEQFDRLRDGDPFWSEAREGFAPGERDALWDTSLADVILRNTDVDAIQHNVFITKERLVGTADGEHLIGTNGADFVFGSDGDDKIEGRKSADDLQGGLGNDTLRGNMGHDTLDGGAGNDRLLGLSGSDHIFGGDGNDHLSGGAKKDRLHGEDGDDRLFGNSGADFLSGGAGNDFLNPGYGDDTITGGSGEDFFFFDVEHTGTNVITDFENGVDTLKLRTVNISDISVERIGDDRLLSTDAGWSLTLEDYYDF